MASVQQLKQELREKFLHCGACREDYVTTDRSPRKLPCSHVICDVCLQQTTTGNDVRCIQCKPEAKIDINAILLDRIRLKLLEIILDKSKTCTKKESTQETQTPVDAASELLMQVVEALLTCNICECPFLEGERCPLVLPCQHDLCSKCAHKMAPRGELRCHNCRVVFNLEEVGHPDALLQSMMEWLQLHAADCPALFDDHVSVEERMFTLQEQLQEKEDKFQDSLLPGGVVQFRGSEGMEPTPAVDAERDKAFKELTEACLQTVMETYQHPSGAREVWSTMKIAMDKIGTHSFHSAEFCKVLGGLGGVEFFTRLCQQQPDVEDQHALYILMTSLVILCNMAKVKDGGMGHYFVEAKTVEMACALVREDLLDKGVVKKATDLLFYIYFAAVEHKTVVGDTLAQEKYPEACLEIIRKTQSRLGGPECSKYLLPTLRNIYSTFWNYTAASEMFTKALTAAGAPQIMTDNLERTSYLDETSNEDYSFLIVDSLQILIHMQHHAVPEVISYLLENDAVDIVVNLVRREYIQKEVTCKALNLILNFNYDAKEIQEAANHLVRLGFPAQCVDVMREVHRMGPFSSDTVKRVSYFVYKTIWNPSYHSSLFAQALVQADAVDILVQDCLRGRSTDKVQNDVFEAAINVLQNMSRFPETRKHLVEKGTTRALMGLLEEENQGLLMTVISLLTATAEAEEDILVLMEHVDGKGIVAALLEWLEAGAAMPNRRWIFTDQDSGAYFPLTDIMELLSRLARLHADKSKVLQDKLPEVLCRLIDDGIPAETGHVTACLLALAQDPEVRARLAQNEALTSRLQAFESATCTPLSDDVIRLLSLLGKSPKK